MLGLSGIESLMAGIPQHYKHSIPEHISMKIAKFMHTPTNLILKNKFPDF
ncbi:hypothetical protein HCUR_00527 [Holospora curviuscula]|uniref:Uncharacterized protein n=1 Tax=Holospora curviuscula TaxID=1082868 RepID=A0A2S5R9X0_9PROT|nr:hypothetical protein HCUR_00527 [Holospora curviuscula]